MEPSEGLSDGSAELRGYPLGPGEINRARAQGGCARSCRGEKTKNASSCGNSQDNCSINQVAAEEDAQGTRQSLARCSWQRCQVVADLNVAKPRLAARASFRSDHSAARRDQISEKSPSVSVSTRLA